MSVTAEANPFTYPVDEFPEWNPLHAPGTYVPPPSLTVAQIESMTVGQLIDWHRSRGGQGFYLDTRSSPSLPRHKGALTHTQVAVREERVEASLEPLWHVVLSEVENVKKVAELLGVNYARNNPGGHYVAALPGRGFVPFGQVWGNRARGKAMDCAMSGPALSVWTAGLLIAAGLAEPAPVDMPPLPEPCSP